MQETILKKKEQVLSAAVSPREPETLVQKFEDPAQIQPVFKQASDEIPPMVIATRNISPIDDNTNTKSIRDNAQPQIGFD